jgi:hypothetical protein
MHYLGFEFLNFSELHSGMMSLCGTGRPASVMLWYLKVPSKRGVTPKQTAAACDITFAMLADPAG